MTNQPRAYDGSRVETILDSAQQVMPLYPNGVTPPLASPPEGPLHVGVDLGTATLALVVLNEDGQPLVGEYLYAEVVRDGVVVDYIGAVDRLREMKARVERRLGRELTHAASAFPPGVPMAEVRAVAHVVEAAGMECVSLVDEPSAANLVLSIENGAVVDVGGGTTGIAVFKDGEVVYTADEPTGGRHFSLVLSGALDISYEEAEILKKEPGEQARLFPMVRPVMEKMATITRRHLKGWPVDSITLVGGCSTYPGMARVFEEITGVPVDVPSKPIFVTPLGIARRAGVEMSRR